MFGLPGILITMDEVEHVIVLTLTQLFLLLHRLFVSQRPFLCFFFFVFFYIRSLFCPDFLFLVFSFLVILKYVISV